MTSFLLSVDKESACNAGDPGLIPGQGRSAGEGTGFPGGLAGKESAFSAGDLSSILGLGRPPGEGKGYPPQYSNLESSTGLYSSKSQRVPPSDFHFHFKNFSGTLGTLNFLINFRIRFSVSTLTRTAATI